MENSFYALILGIVQGLTEFLPVSSSGHLVLAQELLGFREPALLLDTVLHGGTLVAAIIFLRPQIEQIFQGAQRIIRREEKISVLLERDPGVRWILFIVLATIPTGLIGVGFKDLFEKLFADVRAVGIALCVTGLILLSTSWIRKTARVSQPITWARALLVGLAQSVAIIPGISRSGATIATALFLGIEMVEAARLSFLISIPAILGALILQIRDLSEVNAGVLLSLVVGFFSAMISGYYSLRWLFRILEKERFHLFGYYCLPLGVVTLILDFI